jgi:hypothetical protein
MEEPAWCNRCQPAGTTVIRARGSPGSPRSRPESLEVALRLRQLGLEEGDAPVPSDQSREERLDVTVAWSFVVVMGQVQIGLVTSLAHRSALVRGVREAGSARRAEARRAYAATSSISASLSWSLHDGMIAGPVRMSFRTRSKAGCISSRFAAVVPAEPASDERVAARGRGSAHAVKMSRPVVAQLKSSPRAVR